MNTKQSKLHTYNSHISNTTKTDTINVATINAQQGPGSMNNKERIELLIDIIRRNDYDLVALQELRFKVTIDNLKNEFADTYHFIKDTSETRQSNTKFDNESGLVLLSKFEYTNMETHLYDQQSKFFESTKKGIQKVTINYEEQDIDVYNTQFTFKNSLIINQYIKNILSSKNTDINIFDKNKLSKIQRFQTKQFKDFVSKTTTLVNQGIILGDFNIFSNYLDVLPKGFYICDPKKGFVESNMQQYFSRISKPDLKSSRSTNLIMITKNLEAESTNLLETPIISDRPLVDAQIYLK